MTNFEDMTKFNDIDPDRVVLVLRLVRVGLVLLIAAT
jgi:hypothetical protein